MDVGIHSITESVFEKLVIFFINTKRGQVYMSSKYSDYLDSKRRVVFVDARKFLQLWKNEPYDFHADLSYGNESTWLSDYKYQHADRGFSHGLSNPVPLAHPVCQHYEKKIAIWKREFIFFKKIERIEKCNTVYVDFINGITRTIWLLANGASAFPVEVDNKNARLLNDNAGIGVKPQSVSELIRVGVRDEILCPNRGALTKAGVM